MPVTFPAPPLPRYNPSIGRVNWAMKLARTRILLITLAYTAMYTVISNSTPQDHKDVNAPTELLFILSWTKVCSPHRQHSLWSSRHMSCAALQPWAQRAFAHKGWSAYWSIVKVTQRGYWKQQSNKRRSPSPQLEQCYMYKACYCHLNIHQGFILFLFIGLGLCISDCVNNSYVFASVSMITYSNRCIV